MKDSYDEELSLFFEYLVRRYTEVIRRVIETVLTDPDDAEDALQDTFLAAWISLDRLADRNSAFPWLYSIAKHTAIDVLRKNSRHRQISLWETAGRPEEECTTIGEMLPDSTPGPEEMCIIRAENRNWDLAFRMLPEHYKRHLYLRYYMQLKTAEIDRRMGISEQARKSACCRARRAMEKNYRTLERL